MKKLTTILATLLLMVYANRSHGQTTITMQKEGGVYTVPCNVNGLKLKFIFDTGASDVSVSLTEALFMLKNGYLKSEDILGKQYFSDATGELSAGTKIILRKLEFAGLTLYNVEASIVHELSAPLLLGQSAMTKLGKFQLDPNSGRLVIMNGQNNTYDYGKETKAFEIKFKVKGLSNEKVLIAYRYADNQYIKDTLLLDENGSVTWWGANKLDRGVYMMVIPSMNNNYFEFLISDPQTFKLETDKSDLNRDMKVTGSKENQVFFDDLLYMSKARQIADEYVSKSKAENKDTAAFYTKKLSELDKQVKAYRTNLINSNPNTLYAKILNALQEREPAEVPRNKDGSAIDTNFAYKDYLAHYWDNIDFSEEGLIRSPIYANKLENYFEKTLVQIPDTLIKGCDFVLKQARANKEIFKYTLVTLLNKYASTKIMCMDAIYVHLVLNYYAKGDAPWVDSFTLMKMKMEANKKLPILCDKIAPNLILTDTTGVHAYSMYDIKSKYTIIVVWDPDCGHCKKEIPQLANIYPNLKKLGATIYAVSTVSYEEIDKWKEFIRTNKCDFINVADPYNQFAPGFRTLYDISSTPVIYVLDKDKRIIAKRIGVEQIEDFLIKYDEIENKKANRK